MESCQYVYLFIYMKNIQDLHFNKEILPLFDFTHQEHSREALVQLLSEMPGSVEEIHLRQQILQCLIDQEMLQAPFSYSRLEFMEVYRTIEDLGNQGVDLSGSPSQLTYLFFKSKKDREAGRLHQLFIFWHRVQQAYFIHLNPDNFPEDFGNHIRNIRRFLAELNVDKYAVIARSSGFSISTILHLTRLLQQKIREGEMAAFWGNFFVFEAYLSISRGIRKHNFTFPSFGDAGLTLTDFYHPLIRNPVKNSLTISGNVVLITGPNMSGKSTLLKAIGLCVLLGHLGLAVPARQCELVFYEVISIAINLNDDLKSGYSHFMMEVQTLKKVVLEARRPKKCFAVFDELFRGTNVEDALAISTTTIAGLTKFPGCCFLISTHLHQLKERIPEEGPIGMFYLECQLGEDRPLFTYRLRDGWSDLKIGQIIFEQEGLNTLLGKPPIG